MINKYFLTLFFCACLINVQAQKVNIVTTTPATDWLINKPVSFQAAAGNDHADITLYPEQKLQLMDGFGGCFNELGWEALGSLPLAARDHVFRDLFSADGANFSICRLPVGASDYALSWYSYDDVPDDFTMRNFNIDRDRYILIPYIKEAQKIHPGLKFWASPWSPPTWMKVNNHYALTSGSSVKGSNRGDNEMGAGKNIANNATAFKMDNSYLEAYALYFSRYIKAYQKEGVDIGALHVQNEIAYAPQWPSCTWRPEDLGYFIKKYLGPKFKADTIKTEIWLGTINYGNPDYVRKILTDTAASRYIKGVGFQWAGKNAIGTIGKEFPQVKVIQTESECGNGENNWVSAEHTWQLVNHYINNGASAYMYWNMVLDSTGSSSWGWPQNMLIAINKQTKEVKYNKEYYLMKQLSHHVMPGATHIKTSESKDNLAFLNPDGTFVLMLSNLDDKEKKEVITVGDKKVELLLQPRSINTLTWKP